MSKVFISHSSKQKLIASTIANKIGVDRCELDQLTFETGNKTMNEIINSIQRSDLFVILLSKDALLSKWVQQELLIAKERFDQNLLHRIYPLLIDSEISFVDSRIPEWLRSEYNLRPVLQPSKIATMVTRRLKEISWERFPVLKEKETLFIGRNDLVKKFEERLGDIQAEYPITIIAAGLPQIGRRSLLKHCLRKSYMMTEASQEPLVIGMDDSESVEDFILKVLDLGISEAPEDRDELMNLGLEDKIAVAGKLIADIQQTKDWLLIEDNGAIISYDREVADWYKRLMRNRSKFGIKDRITMLIASKFRPKAQKMDGLPMVFHLEVPEMDMQERQSLFKRLLHLNTVELSTDQTSEMLKLFNGLPLQIWKAVDLLKNEGFDYVRKYSYLVSNFQIEMVNDLLKEIEQSELLKEIIGVLIEFEFISSVDLHEIIGPINSEEFERELEGLIGRSICEYSGLSKEYIRLNEVIRAQLRRREVGASRETAAKIQRFAKEGLISFDAQQDLSIYLYSITKALRENKDMANAKLLPSVYIKTIAFKYEIEKKYGEVESLAKRLLENSSRFDEGVIREVNYWLCMALARNKKDELLKAVKYFEKDHKSSCHFLMGFYYRMIGQTKSAIHEQLGVLKIDHTSRKAKRELVINYLRIDEHERAHEYAKNIYESEPGNAFHIQAYCECKLMTQKGHPKIRQEALALLEELKRNSSRQAREKALLIEADIAWILNSDHERAIDLLQQAEQQYGVKAHSAKRRFEIWESKKNLLRMERTLDDYRKSSGKEEFLVTNQVKIMEATILAYKKNREAALQKIGELSYFPDFGKETQRKKILRILESI